MITLEDYKNLMKEYNLRFDTSGTDGLFGEMDCIIDGEYEPLLNNSIIGYNRFVGEVIVYFNDFNKREWYKDIDENLRNLIILRLKEYKEGVKEYRKKIINSI